MSKSIANRQVHISASAILFGALIGIGFWITIAALGAALGLSFQSNDNNLPSSLALAILAVLAISILTSTFFLAGFIASKISHQQFRFDSIVHSLSTWALMAILIAILISGVSVASGLKNAFSGVHPPALVTDIELFEGKAITTVEGAKNKSAQLTRDEKRTNKILEVVWWVSFISLLLGLGASISGGLLGRRKIANL